MRINKAKCHVEFSAKVSTSVGHNVALNST